MISTVKSYALNGIDGYLVDVEADAQAAVPAFDIVGLAGNGIKEARNRVRSAIANSGFEFPPRRITINLAPADIKKDGSHLDLPIAIAFLSVSEQISPKRVSNHIFIGELSLDGSVRAVAGILPMLISAKQSGYNNFVIPYDNISEAENLQGLSVYPVKTLSDTVALINGLRDIPPVAYKPYTVLKSKTHPETDIKEIKGQLIAKRAVEVAVAGGHNILMNGAPGAGKTMLAHAIAGIMPQMTFDEAIETTKIHSVAGLLKDTGSGIITQRPFRSPHHTASAVSIIGGGHNSLPGEISLANNGVLFLDELPEYPRATLETLRQPLEDGNITVTRINRTVRYPANVMLVASMNPCPCGNKGSATRKCTCSLNDIKRYMDKLSGPLLDRFDICTPIDDISFDDYISTTLIEDSGTVRERIQRARKIQEERYKGTGIFTNARMTTQQLNTYCVLDKESENVLRNAFAKYNLTARGITRVKKIARTIADLNGRDKIAQTDIWEAISLRTGFSELG